MNYGIHSILRFDFLERRGRGGGGRESVRARERNLNQNTDVY